MKKQYEVKDKEDSIKTFFLQYAERLSSEINYELRKKKRDIPDDVFGALYASIPDSVLNTMNSWCVFPKFFSKEYHFEVYLSNKEQQNYLGIYTVKAYSRDIAYERALTLVSDELKSSMPNMKFVDDVKKLLVIKHSFPVVAKQTHAAGRVEKGIGVGQQKGPGRRKMSQRSVK